MGKSRLFGVQGGDDSSKENIVRSGKRISSVNGGEQANFLYGNYGVDNGFDEKGKINGYNSKIMMSHVPIQGYQMGRNNIVGQSYDNAIVSVEGGNY
jgi:hypothetical protein